MKTWIWICALTLAVPLVSACGVDVETLEKECQENGNPACAELLKVYQEGCDNQDWRSCNGLARMHFEGAFAPEAKDKAIGLFSRACAAGYAGACTNLNMLAGFYANGEGVPKDIGKAAEIYQKACDGGVAEACETLKTLPQ